MGNAIQPSERCFSLARFHFLNRKGLLEIENNFELARALLFIAYQSA